MAAKVTRVSAGPPLPLPLVAAVVVAVGVELVEGDDGGAVFVWGNAAWCWQPGDVAGRRLAAVQLVVTGAAGQRQVADAFGVNENTVWRWRSAYEGGGVAALTRRPKGPRGPSKLTEDKVAQITAARAQGLSMQAVAEQVGVSLNSVSRALKNPPATTGPAPTTAGPALAAPAQPAAADSDTDTDSDSDSDTDTGDIDCVDDDTDDIDIDIDTADIDDGIDSDGGSGGGGGAALVALARPVARTGERQAARAGLLVEAAPVITQGAGLPLAGALTLLPALAVTGLLDVAEQVYGRRRAGFYGLRSLLLALVFAAAVGAPRAEALGRVDPADLGRLLGLDRAPEVKTVRRRVGELAAAGRADRLLHGLAARHVAAHDDAVGIFYVDGHVRAYHGAAAVPKHHVARMRIAMPAEEDIWVGDARGDGLLVWQAPPGASLVGELRRVTADIRELVGATARPTVCFDRGGWSPKLFAELDAAGFDVLTYRKGVKRPEPASAFAVHTVVDDHGREHDYDLADRRVRITYDSGRRRFACRQITRRSANGHQTQVVTTRTDANPAVIAHAMFSRWRQENFFRYMRQRYALDALDAYATVADDPNRVVPNPARRAAVRAVTDAAQIIADGQACYDHDAAAGVPAGAREDHDGLRADLTAAREQLAARQAHANATPARAPISVVRPDSRRLDDERKRIHDAVRMATYNAESALARLLAPHYARADDEARTLLGEIFTAPADLHVVGDHLHVRIHPLSAPRRTRALAGLCADLTATRTPYPGTNLTLVYSVKDH